MTERLLGRSFVASSPVLLAFFVALGLYLPIVPEAAIFLSTIIAALGAVLGLPPSGRPTKVSRLLVLCALGLLGGSLSANLVAPVPFLPSPVVEEAQNGSGGVAIMGRARSDAVETVSGLYRLSVRLESVAGAEGAGGEGSQSWPGSGTLLFRRVSSPNSVFGASPLFWGDRFSAVGSLWCPDRVDDCVFVADEVTPEAASGAAIDDGPWGRLLAARRRARRRVAVALTLLPGDIRPLTGALVLGDRGFLRAEVVDGFRGAGLSHILALSGMHLGIVAGSMMLVFRRIVGRRGGAVAGMLVAWGYVFLVGPGASLLRAAVMFTIWGLLRLRGKRSSPLNVLGYSFVALVLLWPAGTREIGFSFSFLALAGLLLIGVPIGRHLERWVPPVWAAALGVSLGAFLATAPLSLYLFGFAAPVGILGSVLAGPLVVLVLWAGMVLLGGALLGVLVLPALWIAQVSQELLLFLVDLSARMPIISLPAGTPWAWVLGASPLLAVGIWSALRLARVEARRRNLDGELLLV